MYYPDQTDETSELIAENGDVLHPASDRRIIRGPMDLAGDIIAYEQGDMTREEVIVFFQRLIDCGLAWKLQGHYGRMAKHLIEVGLCTLPGRTSRRR